MIEVYRYETGSVIRGYKDNLERQYRRRRVIPIDEKLKYRDNKLYKSKRQLKRLLYANTDELDQFITLTFADRDIDQIDEAYKYFVKFKDRLRKQSETFRYIMVYNYQEDNTIHFHMLCDLDISQSELSNAWG